MSVDPDRIAAAASKFGVLAPEFRKLGEAVKSAGEARAARSDDAQPMDPERLVNLREGVAWNSSDVPVPHDLVCELLADRDRLAADASHMNDALCIVLGCEPGALDLGDLLGERLGDLGLADARVSAVMSSTLAAASRNVGRGAGS